MSQSCDPDSRIYYSFWAYMESLWGEILLTYLSLYYRGLFRINVVTHLYDFLSSQLVIWGADVGDLHLRGLPVPRNSCWRALQAAQRGTSHGQARQLHQWAVRIFTCFNQNFHQIHDSTGPSSTLFRLCAAVTSCSQQTIAQMCYESCCRRAQRMFNIFVFQTPWKRSETVDCLLLTKWNDELMSGCHFSRGKYIANGFSRQVHDDERLLACHLVPETYLQAASRRSGSHPHPQQQRGEPPLASHFFTHHSASADLNNSYTKISWQRGALVTAQYDTFLHSVSQSKLNQALASTCRVQQNVAVSFRSVSSHVARTKPKYWPKIKRKTKLADSIQAQRDYPGPVKLPNHHI